jgi:hypothetical protein
MARGAIGKVKPEKPPEAALLILQRTIIGTHDSTNTHVVQPPMHTIEGEMCSDCLARH